MTTTAAMPAAKERPRRTRTKRKPSSRSALKLSSLLPSHIDLREPLRAVLVCEDCKTWCPITGMQSRIQKLVPHHAGKAGVADAVRCPGSNRIVEFDITILEWRQALTDANKEASSRQPTIVLPKPFSPRTDQTLRARAERTPAGRVADWKAVLGRVGDVDADRERRPAGDAPLDGPSVPLTTLHPQRPAG
ncbi:hypothetical protein [Streptomyces sp. NBC_01565]|uniref:hypothetical protein n=1 Tax=unclassified Streptomyces TaxID=2593676 RepID=UPI0022544884|nr:hypothetical protein [Streptomyces sp. NBC_01565]MCX4546495.1 hypothetical protein [Streptomyces sp. NBC_01565]